MKKFYALLMTCLLLVFLSVPQIVDAGVGHSRSGGSSRSSSRSSGGGSRSGGSSYHYYRSGYGSSSDSSASSPYLGFMFILVGGIILVVIVKSLQNKSGDSNSTFTSNDSQTLHRRVEHNTLAISRVKYGDPNFDAEAFTSWVKEVYLKLQVAWTEKNWNSVRALESTSLYSQHSAQLEDHIRAKTTNVLEKVCIENVRIQEFL